MNENDTTVVDALAEQAEDLAHIHDHPTRIVANLDIPTEALSAENTDRATFDVESLAQMFLYKEVRDFGQTETVRRLRGAAYVYVRFKLERPPTQGGLSYVWRKRFNPDDRRIIEEAGERIRTICENHDLVARDEPALDPDDIRGRDIEEEQIMDAVQRATDLAFGEFKDPRASNLSYLLDAFFERQGYLNMTRAGTTTHRRRFARLSDREKVPHGSTHNRTLKKVADPDPQTDLWGYEDGIPPGSWRLIRDELLPAYHRAVENILDEMAGADRSGIGQPVNAAFDITTLPYHPSPHRDEADIEWDDEPVIVEPEDGEPYEMYPREDFPEMVSGKKESHERAYKFATLTIVADDTPIVLAIEPVRDVRRWEDEDEVDTRTRGELVDALLAQAEQHVEINKVYADREFDALEVRHVVDQRDDFYVIPKRKQAKADRVAIEKTVEHDVADVSVEHGTLTYDGETHDISFIYVPTDAASEEGELTDGDYAIFTVNAHVSPDRAMGLVRGYRDRWRIECQYKSIKEHFLPQMASKDYRSRFIVFVIGVLMYNVWRMTNFLLRDEVDVDLGESPPIPAGEIVELVGLCLYDSGG